MALKFYELVFDDWNEEECARHGVAPREIEQVLDNAPAFMANRGRHAAQVLMVGPTFGDRFLTVPLVEVDREFGVWRPATAWDADAEEKARYARSSRRA